MSTLTAYKDGSLGAVGPNMSAIRDGSLGMVHVGTQSILPNQMATVGSRKDGSLGSLNMQAYMNGSLGNLNMQSYRDGSLGGCGCGALGSDEGPPPLLNVVGAGLGILTLAYLLLADSAKKA